MGIVFKNNAKTTLASSLSNSATSATVTDGSVFPSLSAGEFFLLTFDDGTNNEICKCTARSGNTLTIVRAQESTTARAFSSGDAAEGRVTAGVLETIQENIAAKSANQTVYNTTTASSATDYDIGIDPSVEANAMVFLNGVMQHHDTFSFSGSTLTFDAAPPNGMALEVIVDNLINLQSSNLTVDTFTATSGQTDFVLSDTPAAETNLIVFVDGVFQDQDSYTISNNTLTITDGVVLNRGVTVYVINPVNIGTPSDGTVTSAKLSGNITMPGTLTVGSNDVAFDSPTFVVDNANSRVGLGTASPSVPVDIVGDVKMSANLTVDTSTLVVDASNNRVGIGTSPVYPLHVQIPSDGSVGASFRYIGGTNNPGLFFSTNESTRVSSIDASGSTTGILAFKTSGTEYMRIDSSGKLLIGDSASHVDDLLQIETPASGGGHGIQIRRNDSNTDQGIGRIMFGNNTDTDLASIFVKTDGSTDNAAMTFNTQPNGGALTERMRIDSSGNVGINTDTPLSKLHVHDTAGGAAGVDFPITITGDRYQADYGTGIAFRPETESSGYKTKTAILGSGGGYGYNQADLHFCINSNNSTSVEVGLSDAVMTLKKGGNVGIGETSPQDPLHLTAGSGDEITTFRVSTAGALTLSRNHSVSPSITTNMGSGIPKIQLNRNSVLETQINAYGDSWFGASGVGNVGIGQTSPATTLHIGDGASHYVRIENAASGDVASGYQIYRGASTMGMQLYDNPGDDATTLLGQGSLNFIANGSGIDIKVKDNGSINFHGTGTANKSFEVQDRQSGYSSFWVDDNNRDYGRGITNAYGLLGGNSTQYDGDGASYPVYGFGGAVDNHSAESLDFYIKSTTSEWQPTVFFAIASSTNTSQTGQTAGWALIRATHYNNGVSTSILDSGGGGTFSLSVIGSMDASDYMTVRVAYSGGQNRCTISVWCNTYQHIRGVTR